MEINEFDDLDNIWISNAFVRINYRRGNIVMVANKEGFLSLSNMFKSMAENGISDDHMWICSYYGYFDRKSNDIVISITS